MKVAKSLLVFFAIMVAGVSLGFTLTENAYGKGKAPQWISSAIAIGSFVVGLIAAAYVNRKPKTVVVPKIEFYDSGNPTPRETVDVDLADSPFKAPVMVKPTPVVGPKDPYQGFVVVDVETTGLNPDRNKIIEIAAIKVMDIGGENHKGFSTLVKISGKVPEKIIQITGITDDMLKADGAELEEVMKYFAEFVEDLPIVAYNAEFDKGFIKAAAQKVGIEHRNEYHCALKMMRAAWPGRMSYKLSAVTEFTDLAYEKNHRALGDCKKTFKVYAACLEKLGQPIRV